MLSLFGLGFLILGIFVIFKGIKSYSARKRLIAEMVSVDGTVLSWAKTEEREADGRTSTSYTPTISFETPAGERREFISRVSGRFPDPAVGGTIKLRYLQSDPTNVVIDKAGYRFAGQVMICIAGLILALAGLITLIVSVS